MKTVIRLYDDDYDRYMYDPIITDTFTHEQYLNADDNGFSSDVYDFVCKKHPDNDWDDLVLTEAVYKEDSNILYITVTVYTRPTTELDRAGLNDNKEGRFIFKLLKRIETLEHFQQELQQEIESMKPYIDRSRTY